MALLTPLFSAIAPFVLWPVELFFPYPAIIEELTKGALVYLIFKAPKNMQIKLVILSGIFFSISETALYLFNIYFSGELYILGVRLVATTFMHLVTFLIIFTFGRKSLKLLSVGVLAAIAVHELFNLYVSAN
ncbi:hypothetical protein HYZ78_01435 [Candidatus Microgenomates bacterium]|nr:hypothetical protein [Candidatus Microgenomates bacterium]